MSNPFTSKLMPQAGVSFGSGDADEYTQRVILANDSPSPEDTISELFEGRKSTVTDSAYKTLYTIESEQYNILSVEVENSGSVALSELIIQLQNHPNGSWYSWLGNSDFANACLKAMIYASDSPRPDQTGAEETSFFRLRIDQAYKLRIVAKTASGSTSVKVRGHIT